MTPPHAGNWAQWACLLEVSAPKVGNVHRGADFEDLTFWDFVFSAAAIAPCFEHADEQGVGETVLAAVQATRQVVARNTNLGTLLLLAPLAAVPDAISLRAGIEPILRGLSGKDAALVYEAIRLAQPGGLGRVAKYDLAEPAPASLFAAMEAASERDLVARQYTNGFEQVFLAADWMRQAGTTPQLLTQSIVQTQLRLLAEFPDSLIARKCGPEVAERASHQAAQVLAAGAPESDEFQWALGEFDFWLRSDGHRRNPGTTADLIAAGLFVLLREHIIEWPLTG